MAQLSREIFFHTAHYYNRRPRKIIHLRQLLGLMKTGIDCVLHGSHQEFHQQRERTTLAAPNINNQLDDHSQHLEHEDEDEDEDEGPQETTRRDKIDKIYDFYLGDQQSNTQSQQQQSQQQPPPQTSVDTVQNGNYNH